MKIRQNNRADKDKENWTPCKASRYQKIDGFAALLDAHAEYMRLAVADGITNEAAGVRVISIDDLGLGAPAAAEGRTAFPQRPAVSVGR